MAFVCVETSADPFSNLAAEELLLAHAAKTGRPVLYLWQNDHTVVIGRNQNPWRECRVALLEEEGGRLARRKTGGGAVYHDRGNLNFSFAMPALLYDEAAQYGFLQSALAQFGIQAEQTGRNDLTVGGAKFSGNAFLHRQGASLHHGTLLIASDPARVGRYLTPSPGKMKAKGVASVASRVVRLQSLASDLTPPIMADALMNAFVRRFGPAEAVLPPCAERAALAEEYANWDFRFGKTPPFDDEISLLTEKGTITLAFSLQNGRVAQCDAAADWLDAEAPARIAKALTGVDYTAGSMAAAVMPLDEGLAAALLTGQKGE